MRVYRALSSQVYFGDNLGLSVEQLVYNMTYLINRVKYYSN